MATAPEKPADIVGKNLALLQNRGTKLGGRPPSLDHLTDPAAIAKLISTTRHLTEDAFEDLVHDVGSRVAILVLRAKACGGDVKAIDLYLKRCDSWRERRASYRPEDRHVEQPSPFQRPNRSRSNEG